jgi:hypothetical protein
MCQHEQSELDKAILAASEPAWNKVAMIISRVGTMLAGILGDEHGTHMLVANRIGRLVSQGQLLAQGDILRWRSAEVRLP